MLQHAHDVLAYCCLVRRHVLGEDDPRHITATSELAFVLIAARRLEKGERGVEGARGMH